MKPSIVGRESAGARKGATPCERHRNSVLRELALRYFKTDDA